LRRPRLAGVRSRIKRYIRKSCRDFLALGNLVSFVTSRLPVDVMFLPKCLGAPSGDGGRVSRACRLRVQPGRRPVARASLGALFESPRRTPQQPSSGRWDGDGATDALALPPLCLCANLRFKDRLPQCAANVLLITRQDHRRHESRAASNPDASA
jgi:hypothetical protein